MNVLVTGATGFVGRHLIELLKAAGHEVWGTCFPEEPEQITPQLACALSRVDIRSQHQLSATVQEADPSWVFHLAGVSSVRYSWQHKTETFETNVTGTFNLLEALSRFAPRARLLFVSSSDVYGIPADPAESLSEATTTRPVSPYGFTKATGEALCDFYWRAENLDIVIARPFPHTGPGQSPMFVCSEWARQIARIEKGDTEPKMSVGDLSIERDFSDARDVAKAYFLLLEKAESGAVYNVCSGKAVFLEHILTTLLSRTSTQISIARVDAQKMRKSDLPRVVGDPGQTAKHIGWKAGIPLEKTLEDLLEDWRSRG